MRFSTYCPEHGRGPGWLIHDGPAKEIKEHYVEGDEMVVRVRYEPCRCLIEYRRPYNRVNSIDGYVFINAPDGYQAEHRFIWEQAHGKILKGMVIHHINGIRADNRLENLIALPKGTHNNSIPMPFNIECPHCHGAVRIIKQGKKQPIILPPTNGTL